MGFKRKASDFEEDSFSAEPTLSSVPSLSSTHSSPSTTYPPSSVYGDSPIRLWANARAPYLDLRTRKRYRDGRPDEVIIHENTLKKLFDAQRQQHTHDTANAFQTSPLQNNAGVSSGHAIHPEAPIERNQTSIEAFFGKKNKIRNDAQSQCETSATQRPMTTPYGKTAASALTCEDCDTPLLAKDAGEAMDVDMLHFDGISVDPQIQDCWACVHCSRRVCDTCAVRGDCRICLECAVPGGGSNRNDGVHEKRWVGGVGWL